MSDQHLIHDLESLSAAPDEAADYAALAREGISRGQKRIRRRRAISAVAVVAGLTAVVLGVTQLGPLLQPQVATTVASTTGANPGGDNPSPTPSPTDSPPAATQPAPSQPGSNRPSPGPLALGSVATFTYFSAQTLWFTPRQGSNGASLFEIGVQVCVLKPPPGSNTVGPADWSLTVSGGTAQWDGSENAAAPDVLTEKTAEGGECVFGSVTFTVDPGADVNQIVYRNRLGETATWAVDRSTAVPSPGSQLKQGQTAKFTHFSATVHVVLTQDFTDAVIYKVSVTVCVNKVPAGASLTTISPAPWQLTVSKGSAEKLPWEFPPLPTKSVAQGGCVSGLVSFLVKPHDAQVGEIVYRNGWGESATWGL